MTNTIDNKVVVAKPVIAAEKLLSDFYSPAYQAANDPKNPVAVMFREMLYQRGGSN